MEASYRQIWRIAWPIIGASLAQNAVSLIDTAFLGFIGQVELAAGGIGVLFFLTIGFIGLGISTGVQVLTAQLLGSGESERLGSLLRQSLWISAFVGAGLSFGLAYTAPFFVRALLHEPETINSTTYFLRGRSLELFPLMLFGALRGYYSGTAQTSYILRANLILASTNLLINILFVIGLGWGMKGVIAGSVLSQYIATTYLFVSLRQQRYNLSSKSEGWWLLPLMRYAGPAILQNLVGMVGWVVFFLLIERRGQFALASANIIRSLYSFSMLPTWGFATAVGTLTGYFWGAKDRKGLIQTLRRAFFLSQGLNTAIALMLAAFAPLWVQLFTRDPAIQAQAARDLPMIALSVFIMPASAVLLFAVVGVGEVFLAFLVEVGVIIVYVSYALWIDSLQVSLTWMWSTEWTYWIPSAIILFVLWWRRVKKVNILALALS
ncbi:MAG: MATE family efflux transporter [Bacteroidia bacterium]|nr:MATE family efflux transporter [Bacteroidia bacterium]MCX7763661.1 MATE family efflux transporter [Bacteroidia bacterium]MDW8057772.1 MATE family efflux transporter [Bacteroidia bacterium]